MNNMTQTMMLAMTGLTLSTTSMLLAKQPVPLTEEEQVQGWKLLFNGENLQGVKSWKTKGDLKEGAWKAVNGELQLVKPAGEDIYFAPAYENYELELEWKSEGNSGILLRVNPGSKGAIWQGALEMQVMNDTADDTGKHSAAALYDMIAPPKGKKVMNKDGWNKVKIVCENGTFTHWFNGQKLYTYTVGDETWNDTLLANSKFKNNKAFGTFKKGVIGLQDHGDKVAYRNIKIRPITAKASFSKEEKFRNDIYKSNGPVVATVLSAKNGAYDVNRGYVVALDSGDTGVVFNADTMQLSGAWLNGGGVAFKGLPFQSGHGATPVWDETQALFSSKNAPGWLSPDGKWDDPRAGGGTPPLGTLPKDWAKFKGYYVCGKDVVFSYSVDEADVLDHAAKLDVGSAVALVRELKFSGLKKAKTLVLADATDVSLGEGGKTAKVGDVFFTVSGSATLENKGGKLLLSVPADNAEKLVQVVVNKGEAAPEGLAKVLAGLKPLDSMLKGGPQRYKTDQPIITKGQISDKKDSYVVDRLTLPNKNPFGKKLRVGGFDFFSDGKSLAFCTWDGDLWKATGIDQDLGELKYQLIATGLHESLGLTIVNDEIYTLGNDQITKHVDLNGDGETDFFQCFNNDWPINKGFHIFSFDLKNDKDGNFWFVQGSPVRSGGRGFERIAAMNGSILKISKDGSKLEQFASGLRAPNGMGVGPNGEITAGDNEGTFVPRCPIHWITPGYFGGVVNTYNKKEELKTVVWEDKSHKHDPSEMPKPLAWLPRDVDNSNGCQIWVPNDKWGMPKGQMLHCSYGTSSIYTVYHETVDGQIQGGVVKIPVRLTSSAMRARFNPADGQLYVGGLRGWQTNAAELGGIDRIRYTGKKFNTLTSVEAKEGGLKLNFNFKLDDELAADPESYAIKAANIIWGREYGTKEYKIDGSGEGWSKMEVTDAKLSDDGMSVFIKVKDLKPVHELKLDIDVETEEGDEVFFPTWMTIHKLGK
ncbi:protein of unknown function [Rubritalea squalenifaciens DSM 18772]|uniref:Uncharacterized protein n=1 Tax=Rubritalea squalenifaciens DSM 18772 TaxID=1123071 RepID=A0A1M6NVG6_9BACT|nr:DUF1080 domain-containing protein [Rubritalea squalenifaciens]SHJ99660.1 protein of unknown function [Rubritalea squalenifaciens DSM 18772]